MSVREALARVPWLAALPGAELDGLSGEADPVAFAAGEAILVELEVGEHLFVLVEGTARVTVGAADPAPRVVGHLGPGARAFAGR